MSDYLPHVRHLVVLHKLKNNPSFKKNRYQLDASVHEQQSHSASYTGQSGGISTNSVSAGSIRDVYHFTGQTLNIQYPPDMIDNKGKYEDMAIKARNNFTETSVSEVIRTAVEEKKLVVISGGPGDGKTTLAVIFSDRLKRQGRVMEVDIIKDLHNLSVTNRKEKKVLIFDDIFSADKMTEPFAKEDLAIFSRFTNTGADDYPDGLQIIITCNNYDLKRFSHFHGGNYLKTATCIDLTSHENKYNDDDKKHISKKYTKVNVKFDQPGFPKMCTYICLAENCLSEVIHMHLRNEIVKLIEGSETQAALFIWMILCEDNFNDDIHCAQSEYVQLRMAILKESSFDKCDIETIKNEAYFFTNTFLKRNGQIISFSDAVIKEACIFAIDFCYPGFLWKHFTIVLYNDDEIHLNKQVSSLSSLHLSETNCHAIVTTLVEQISQRRFSVALSHPILKQNVIIDQVLKLCDNMMRDILTAIDNEEGTFLYWATHCSNCYLCEKILMHSELKMHKDAIISETLMSSVYKNDVDGFEKIVDLAKYDFKQNYSVQFLRTASLLGHTQIVNFLLKKHVMPHHDLSRCPQYELPFPGTKNIEKLHCTCCSPLHFAVIQGHHEIVQLLLKNKTWSSEHLIAALIWSCMKHQKSVYDVLTQHGVHANTTDEHMCTPLMWACAAESIELVRRIIKAGNDVNVQNQRGETALLIACKRGAENIVRTLMSHPSINCINTVSEDGDFPLLIACAEGHDAIAEILLNHGTRIIVNTDVQSPLLMACKNGYVKIVRLLLSSKNLTIDIDATDSHGSTALLLACESEFGDIAKSLMEHKPQPNISKPNEQGNTPLLVACGKGHRETVALLLKTKSQRRRLRLKTKLTKTTTDDGRPLLAACRHGHTEIVTILLSQMSGAFINKVSPDGDTPLLAACRKGHFHIVSILLLHKADVNLKGEYGYTPLMWAAEGGYIGIVKSLLKHKPDVLVMNNDKMTACMIACRDGRLDIAESIVNYSKNAVNVQGVCATTPLMFACMTGHDEIVNLLFSKGSEVDAQDHKGMTALMWAASFGNVSTIKMLLPKVNVNIMNKSGETALSILCKKKKEAFKEVFSVNVRWKHFRWALHNSNNDVVLSLIQAHCPFGTLTESARDGGFRVQLSNGLAQDDRNKILHIVCTEGNVDLLKYILDQRKCEINSRGRDGLTPVMRAAKNGHRGVFDLLVKEGCDLSGVDSYRE